MPFACWEEKPLAKPSLRMKFLATPWLALWLASWQLFLFKARPLQLPSWSQWWLLAVSFVFYNNNVAWFWKIFTRLYCNLYNVLARPIASNGQIKNQHRVNRGFYWFMDHSFVIEKKPLYFVTHRKSNTTHLFWVDIGLVANNQQRWGLCGLNWAKAIEKSIEKSVPCLFFFQAFH